MRGNGLSAFADWDENFAAEVIAPFAEKEGGLLPALHALQERFGYVSPEAVPLLARAFNLSRADVHGTISFYHDFHRERGGRRMLRLCRAEACQACGGEAVGNELRERLGLNWGETTADGAVQLEPSYCLGLCAVAPAALLDGVPMGRVTAAALHDAVRETAQ